MVLLSGCLEDSMSETRKGLSEGKNIRDLSKATAEDAVKDATPNGSRNAITAVTTVTAFMPTAPRIPSLHNCKRSRAKTITYYSDQDDTPRRHMHQTRLQQATPLLQSTKTTLPATKETMSIMRRESVNPSSKSSFNPHASHVKQSTAPALYRTRSVDLLTSFDESDGDAAQNVYRGNQCCTVQQVPTQGNKEEK
uniref:Uncharacterized protein n=1 Tax=Plectus sambesii TaxID=2011161 RepID=A0A914VQ10_9BILA